jgi:hypothetical protein
MKNKVRILIIILTAFNVPKTFPQDSLSFAGQLPVHVSVNSENALPLGIGARYIPRLNYKTSLKHYRFLDFEASANLYGNAAFHLFDSTGSGGDIKLYRLWTRFSTHQLEIRAGLQKINFGSASLLRPLMWFDRIDPRDPLKLTDGVWGLLARYYFLNNANVWLWGLYGNNNLKGWETLPSSKKVPEFGGRFQMPLPHGEGGLTYHHRTADGSSLSDSSHTIGNISENRLGLDAKFDMTVGWWAEASLSGYGQDIGMYTNQKIINLGADYTFGLGNGLTIIYEQLIASYSRKVLSFTNAFTFSMMSINYPAGLFSNIGAIFYYDWKNSKMYNFINFQLQFNSLSLNFMGYINPKVYNIPAQDAGESLFAGRGAMIMLVFNH